MRVIEWMKQNKLLSFLLVVFGWYVLKNYFLGYTIYNQRTSTSGIGMMAPGMYEGGVASDSYSYSVGAKTSNFTGSPIAPDVAPTAARARMTVQNANLALLVKDVQSVQVQISQLVTSIGGYVVNKNVNRPSEQPYGTITMRVPVEKLEETLTNIKAMGLKVTNEEVSGYDVTDQYVDIETRLSYLRRSLAQIQAIQDKAEEFEEILQGTREVQNLQNQIDTLIGQQNYIKQTASLSLVTVTMSTDEMALPYAPDTNFRPALIYKQAVRSVITTLQNWAAKAIWLGVYAVIWIPLAVIALIVWKIWKRKNARLD